MTFTHALATNNYGPAKFIVSSTASLGTHTTIASALTSASSGDTIFIRPGTYTENLTLKAGVNITSYTSESNDSQVIIVGKLSGSYAGNAQVSNIRLQTNSDNVVALSGSNGTGLFLVNCYLDMTNATGITISGSCNMVCIECGGNLGTTGIAIVANSGSGGITFRQCSIANSGNSTTASTASSSGNIQGYYSEFNSAFSTSSTGLVVFYYCFINTLNINTTAITHNGTVSSGLWICNIGAGTATAVTVGSGATCEIHDCVLNGGDPLVSGAGTINITSIATPSGSARTITTTTVNNREIFTCPISFNKGTDFLAAYAKGTWTPTFTGSSVNPTSVTYTVQVGQYIRIGDLVYVHCSLQVNAVTLGSAAGNLQISGLPFTARNVSNYAPNTVVQIGNYDLQAATKYVVGQIQQNTTNIAFIECIDNGAATVTAVTILVAGTSVRFTGVYETT